MKRVPFQYRNRLNIGGFGVERQGQNPRKPSNRPAPTPICLRQVLVADYNELVPSGVVFGLRSQVFSPFSHSGFRPTVASSIAESSLGGLSRSGRSIFLV
jgi:hypothetical protein